MESVKSEKQMDYLPLGSVVTVKGTDTKFMIIARGMCIRIQQTEQLFDYGACPFPTGIIGDKAIYFNHQEISKILHRGYSDADDVHLREILCKAIKDASLEYADPKKLSEQLAKGEK